MGIKDDLAARKARFISLRTLLDAISEHEKVSLQDAAEWLAGYLREASRSDSERKCPDWCEMQPGHEIQVLGGQDRKAAWAALQFVVENGRLGNEWEEMSDDIPF
ncbi:hypothetical protein DPR02_19230 [Burkholderia cepacia]|uniref:Uncharacterized protein n=1 Tax=Burkholderia cepacia TaxID=292 RepID=A0AAQ0FBJ5_BURCE|nr:hypothetical protein [Burkholderia cepacia]RAQ08153.1 hypothetical protein DPR02_19230 [Burkholderia cepacia]